MTGTLRRLLRPFERLADALADPPRSHAAAATLILGYVLLWWVYAVIAKSSQDIHFDMGEVVFVLLFRPTAIRSTRLFPAWVAAAWFAVFPHADWAVLNPLSAVSIGIALWFVWLDSRRAMWTATSVRSRWRS